jgi:uncharacterized protein YsxB (DUF464 family)
MIKARFYTTSNDKHIEEFQIEGHADYAEYGKDIVCAAVSALTITIVNSMVENLGVELNYKEQDGKIICKLPSINDKEIDSKLQLLAQTLMMGLREIAKEYKDSIKIKTITK